MECFFNKMKKQFFFCYNINIKNIHRVNDQKTGYMDA